MSAHQIVLIVCTIAAAFVFGMLVGEAGGPLQPDQTEESSHE